MNSFWSGIRKSNNSRLPLATTVTQCTGESNIDEMWQDHYTVILNSVQNSRYKKNVNEQIAQIGNDSIKLTIYNISDALKSLKKGKAYGVDGLAPEHFIYAHSISHVFLSLLFNYFIVHGYLPSDFMKTSLVPIIKSKTGDYSDKNNYRPIALVTAASKLFEICILEILEVYLATPD